jgi:hypothetical protein
MAEKIISPGVFTRENDQSQVTRGVEERGAAVIGPTVKGPALVPTKVTSYSEYVNKFGTTFKSGSDYYSYMTSLTAREYFNGGGSSLIVTRVVSGSLSKLVNHASASVYQTRNSTSGSFDIEVKSFGANMNNTGSLTSSGLGLGTSNNVRWEISNVNNTKGTFTLLIRRGDDTESDKIILESFTNLSLDPQQSNFISRVVGDQKQQITSDGSSIETIGEYPSRSEYVRIKATPGQYTDSLDNSGIYKASFLSGSLPPPGSGSYGGSFTRGSDGEDLRGEATFYKNITSTASNIQGFVPSEVDSNYGRAITLLANKDEYDYNLLFIPGLTTDNTGAGSGGVLTNALSMLESRGDAFLVTDPTGYGATVTAAVTASSNLNSSYAGMYYPWVQVRDTDLGKNVWVPSSVVMAYAFAYNDKVGAEWFAPAGLIRGGLPSVVQAERKLSQTNKDNLYDVNINAIASFPQEGVVAFGQKTTQKQQTSTDRINVRRLLNNVKNFVSSVSRQLVFEQNTITTRNKFLSLVNPYLDSIVQRQGLYTYRVVMDETNNTADVIDRNQLVGQIFIQPTQTVEFIVLDFNITPTGANI